MRTINIRPLTHETNETARALYDKTADRGGFILYRKMPTVLAGKYFAFTVIYLTFLTLNASAVNCQRFAKEAQSAIKIHVAALQGYEHEASDRLKGLDSRPFEFLRDEAKKTAAIIGEPKALADEEDLKRCRNATRPIRKLCAEAAQMLLEVLETHVGDSKPDYDKPRYAAAMAECEKLMDLKPVQSAIRGAD